MYIKNIKFSISKCKSQKNSTRRKEQEEEKLQKQRKSKESLAKKIA